MSYTNHCLYVARKAYARANLILRCFFYTDRNFLLRLYLIYVRPLLEYNSSVWSPHTNNDISIIERVQEYFSKRLIGMESLTYDERLVALKLPSLSCRRNRSDLILLYKIMHNLIDTSLSKLFQLHSSVSVSNIVTRGHSLKLYEPKPRINIFKFSFQCRVVKLWNNLPNHVCTAVSLSLFKHLLVDDFCV